ncbi:hypothetical protein CY34DRAFT_773691 [Suillus luteus UH-Slu-Lm8-n1]|uniref:Uncharacterized protein n=1 Tax=Suillus luteus UH-Slu-Lm8-n1 TaxID=930992 RepID=A0A0D0AIN4_9AGAM|nr:hypothetical protein CY34DRAFT_773691 [Suillus luteus UH-Slu-Lm8-n1]
MLTFSPDILLDVTRLWATMACLVQRAVPMFPPTISEEACALNLGAECLGGMNLGLGLDNQPAGLSRGHGRRHSVNVVNKPSPAQTSLTVVRTASITGLHFLLALVATLVPHFWCIRLWSTVPEKLTSEKDANELGPLIQLRKHIAEKVTEVSRALILLLEDRVLDYCCPYGAMLLRASLESVVLFPQWNVHLGELTEFYWRDALKVALGYGGSLYASGKQVRNMEEVRSTDSVGNLWIKVSEGMNTTPGLENLARQPLFYAPEETCILGPVLGPLMHRQALSVASFANFAFPQNKRLPTEDAHPLRPMATATLQAPLVSSDTAEMPLIPDILPQINAPSAHPTPGASTETPLMPGILPQINAPPAHPMLGPSAGLPLIPHILPQIHPSICYPASCSYISLPLAYTGCLVFVDCGKTGIDCWHATGPEYPALRALNCFVFVLPFFFVPFNLQIFLIVCAEA